MNFRSSWPLYPVSSPSPYREKVFALLFPLQPIFLPHPISKWPIRPLSHSLHPGYKNESKTPIHWRLSLTVRKPARCAGSHSPLPTLINFILLSSCLMSGNSFQTCTQTTTFLVARTGTLGSPPWPPCFSFLIGTLWKQANAVEATEELRPGLPSGVFQRPHCSLHPSSCRSNGWGSLLFLLFNWGLGQPIPCGHGSCT